MPEYVQSDPATGRIIKTWYSVSPEVVNGISDVIEVPRDTFNAITKYHKVEAGLVVEMTQAEKDALDAEEAAAVVTAENTRIFDLDNLISSTNGMTLTKIDTAIDNINNLADAKTFLKKLCRYIIKFIAKGI